MIDSIQIEMPESDIQILINAVLNAVINRSTIAEIINSILDNLPTCPCDEYISCLEMAAEKLFTLEEPEASIHGHHLKNTYNHIGVLWKNPTPIK